MTVRVSFAHAGYAQSTMKSDRAIACVAVCAELIYPVWARRSVAMEPRDRTIGARDALTTSLNTLRPNYEDTLRDKHQDVGRKITRQVYLQTANK